MPSLTFANVPSFCSRLDFTSHRVEVDLSPFTFIECAALVYLGMVLRSRSESTDFVVTQPRDERVRDYMERQNFWARFGFRDPPVRRHFGAFTSLNEIVDIERRAGVEDQIE